MNTRQSLSLLLLPLLIAGSRADTGHHERWRRSSSLREKLSGKVIGERIKPIWVDDSHFWFTTQSNGQANKFVWIDASTGKRTDFDEKSDIITKANDLRMRQRAKSPVSNAVPSQLESSESRPSIKSRIEDDDLVIEQIQGGSTVELFRTTNGVRSNPYDQRIFISPDQRRIIATRTRPGKRRQIHMVESSPNGSHHGILKTRRYDKPGESLDQKTLILIDLDTKKSRQIDSKLFPNPYSLSRFRWSPNGRRFTFIYNQRGHQLLRMIGVDPETAETRTLVSEVSNTFVCYSYNAQFRFLNQQDKLIWMSERNGFAHLYLIDLASGRTSDLTAGALRMMPAINRLGQTRRPDDRWLVRSIDKVDEQSGHLWITVSGVHVGEDPYHRHLLKMNLDGSDPVIVTDGDGDHTWSFSPQSDYLIDTFSRVDLPPRHVLRDADDGAQICELQTADVTKLLETGWRPPERFVAKGRDGRTDIHGIIMRPTDFDLQKKYPVVEAIYAGPHGSFTPKSWSTHHALFEISELGFIVVKLDGMGTNHRGKAFHDVCWKNLHDSGFPDRKRWITAAAETRPEMDLTRVGIFGGSAGGQSAMRALIDHPDFYHVAVADCGCHDNRVDKIWWNEQWMGWPIGPQYKASSNVEQAHRMTGDLLLLVGELDTNVDPISTMQVVDALIKADKDFEMLVLPGGGHGTASHPYVKRKRAYFLMEHLQ